MTWKIKWQQYDGLLAGVISGLVVRNDDMVAGSIVKGSEGPWRVEVLWSGPSGDIVYEAASKAEAEAFVEGVGRMFDAARASWGEQLAS